MVKRALATDRSQPESAWRERFVRYASSKQTVEAFCLSEAVSVASFYGWRTRLRNGRGNVLPAPRTVPLPAASPFIDIFFRDPQALGYVTPRLSSIAEKISGDYVETANHVKLICSEGEIDFARGRRCQRLLSRFE